LSFEADLTELLPSERSTIRLGMYRGQREFPVGAKKRPRKKSSARKTSTRIHTDQAEQNREQRFLTTPEQSALEGGIHMRKVLLTAAILSAFATGAMAQKHEAASKVEFGTVSSDAVLTKNLLGLKLTNAHNDTVGEIKDLVIAKGALKGYILSVGGFLGMGDHYVEVTPASVSINYDTNDKKWKGMINATKDQLKAAPEFKYEGRLNN
jgi:hypothetical protein